LELTHVRVDRPEAGRVRFIGEVVYNDCRGEPEDYWFDFPESYAGSWSGP
jgi:hypothetical protein